MEKMVWFKINDKGNFILRENKHTLVLNAINRNQAGIYDLVTNPVISREWGKDRKVLTTSGTYPWSFVSIEFGVYLH
jgi:hypothetical protein